MALLPLVLTALVILKWDTSQRTIEARAEADRSAEALARNLDAVAGTAMRQVRALADSDSFRSAYTAGERADLGRQADLLKLHPAWLGTEVVDDTGTLLVRRGVVPLSDLPVPPEPGHLGFLPRSGSVPPTLVVVAQLGPAEKPPGRLIGAYSLQEIEHLIGAASDRSGITLVTSPEGVVLLGPLGSLGTTVTLTPSHGNLVVHLEDRQALAAVAPAAGGAFRAIALRISAMPGRSALPALGGLALAAGLVVSFIVGWQIRLAHMVRRLGEREKELATLNELATDSTMSHSASQVIQMAGARAARLFSSDRGFVALRRPDTKDIELHGTFPTPTDTPLRLDPTGNPHLARTLRHGRREIGPSSPSSSSWASVLRPGGWECWTPLVAHGRIFGALGLVCSKREMEFEAEEGRLLDGIAATLAVALESHQRLAEVKEQRAMLATIVEASPDGLLALDENTRILLDNPAARHLLALDHPATGLLLDDLIEGVERAGHHFEWDFAPQKLLALARQGQTTTGTFRLLGGGRVGRVRRMESMMAPLPLPLGETGALVTMRDVSERDELAVVRNLHEQVSLLARQTSARAALLEQVLAAADVGMAFLGADRMVSWDNRLFTELLGLDASVRGLTATALEARMRSVVDDGFPGLRPGVDLLRVDAPNRRILAMRVVEIRDTLGHEVGLLVSLRDETAQRELAEAREQFIGIAAHELKNPLAVLRIQAELGLRDEKKREDALHRILLRASQLQELIDRLLDATRAELGKLSLEWKEVSLLSIAQDAAEPFLAQGAPIQIEGDDVRIEGDPVRLKQVLGNLISNAVRYGGDAPIEVRLSSGGEDARVSVRDRGPGIPWDEQKTIFERFGQARAARKGQGLGLGLFLAQRIVEAHGGTLSLQSAPGQGSTFTVCLPGHRLQEPT